MRVCLTLWIIAAMVVLVGCPDSNIPIAQEKAAARLSTPYGLGELYTWQVATDDPNAVDVQVWADVHTPGQSVRVVRTTVLFEWDQRLIRPCGAIYQTATTVTRGDIPAGWTCKIPIRWMGWKFNSTWLDGNALLVLEAPGVCQPWVIDHPTLLATLHFRRVGGCYAPTYFGIDNWNYTRLVGPYNTDPCSQADRAYSRQGCDIVCDP